MKKLNILSIMSLLITSFTITACGGGGGDGGGGSQQDSIISKSSVNSSLISSLTSSSTSNNSSSMNSSINQSSQSSMNSQSSLVSSANSSNFALNIFSPASGVYIPVNRELEITASFSGISANQLEWKVFPNTNVSITPVTTTSSSATVKFKATQKGSYSIQLTNTANIEYAGVDIDVHPIYLAVDSTKQNRILLDADGRIISDLAATPGEPSMSMIAAGTFYGVAVDNQGAVRQWGSVPAPLPLGLNNVKHIAAATYGAVAIKHTGDLVIWGKVNNQLYSLHQNFASKKILDADPIGSTNLIATVDTDNKLQVFSGVDGSEMTLPTSWQTKKFVQVCGLNHHLLALENSGLIYIWNSGGEAVPELESLPETLVSVEKIFCNGDSQAAAIQTDGEVVVWGADSNVAYFDSSNIVNFPEIKSVSLFSNADPTFLTKDGAYIDRYNQLVPNYND
jgi:hypothetical protein